MRKILSGRRCSTCLILSQIGHDIDGINGGIMSGISVSISADGTRVAIGNIKPASAGGLVRVWQKDPSNTTIAPIGWTQVGSAIAQTGTTAPQPSVSISADGTIVAVGDSSTYGGLVDAGRVLVYEENPSNTTIAPIGWTQLGPEIDGAIALEESGWSVSIVNSNGSNLLAVAIGSPGYSNDTGRVKVFYLNGSAWTQLGPDIVGTLAGDFCGLSVSFQTHALGFRILAIGYPGDTSATGKVKVFYLNGSAWTQLGSDIVGASAGDEFGRSVSLSRDATTVAIGAPYNGAAGYVRVYQRNPANTTIAPLGWTKIGSDINGEANGDESGTSVSLNSDGTILAIGAPWNEGNGYRSGHVRLYKYDSSTWTQLGCDIDGEAVGDISGWSVSLNDSGTALAIGAPLNDGDAANGADTAGHVRVYAIDHNCTPIYGCCDPLACNYDPNVNTNNGTCIPFTTAGSVTTSICAGDSYTWPANGQTYTTAQTNVTYTSGCNIATLNLTITPLTTAGSVTTSICTGTSYTWPANGVTYTTAQSGVTVVSGCNTATLNLTITPLTTPTFNFYTAGSPNTFCSDFNAPTTSTNGITGTWSPSVISMTAGTNTYTFTPAAGQCADTLTITITTIDPVYGCTDPTAFNYDANATCNDGSCIPYTFGCTDPTATNYNPTVNTSDNSCIWLGCTDPTACNYDATANVDDGSCAFWPEISGEYVDQITDTTAKINWDIPACIIDIFKIRYREQGTATWTQVTTDPLLGYKTISSLTPSTTYEYQFKIWYNNGSITGWHPAGPATPTFTTLITPVYGCTDPGADNYNPTANTDDGSCTTAGCTDPNALNYNSAANLDNGTCCSNSCTYTSVPNGNMTDGINAATLNASPSTINIAGALPQAYIDSAYTTFNPGTWYRFSGTSNQMYEYNSRWYGSNETGVVQKLSGLIVGATYEFVITLTTNPAGCTFYQYVDNNVHQTTSIPPAASANCCTANVQFVAQTTSDTFVFKGLGSIVAWSMMIDGVGTYPSGIPGCCDPTALNYDANATCDDGTCTYV